MALEDEFGEIPIEDMRKSPPTSDVVPSAGLGILLLLSK
jgi:hypothetical protein